MLENLMIEQPSRTIYLGADIDNGSVAETCSNLLKVIKYDIDGMNKYRNWEITPIDLYIQSFGGSVDDMWALIDIIESSQTPIFTYCSGYCMSSAALIFLAGHYRYMSKHSHIMFHQMSVGSYDKITDRKLTNKYLDEEHKEMMKYIKKHTKLGKKFFKRFDKNKEDIYLTSKECLKYGICDEIIKKSNLRKEVLSQIEASKNVNYDYIM
jgi:ATP-dependent Clp protease protease subunit